MKFVVLTEWLKLHIHSITSEKETLFEIFAVFNGIIESCSVVTKNK